jgi:signal peptidase II
MNSSTRLAWYSIAGGFFLLLDQSLKYLAFHYQNISFSFGTRWLGWEFLGNPGVAFSLPFPNIVLVTITPIVILGLFLLLRKQASHGLVSLGIILIIFGAASNLIDRILLGITIDYLRIATSVINLADVMIVIGALLLISAKSKKKRGS